MAAKRIIEAKEMESLASLQCTQQEIAAFFRVSHQAVEKALKKPDLREAYERGLHSGRISLRRAQFKLALDGNATMQIWLGKQLLGQRDKMEHSGPGGGSLISLADIDAIIAAAPAGA